MFFSQKYCKPVNLFFMQNTKDILNNVVKQTTLAPTDFHFMDHWEISQNVFFSVPQKKKNTYRFKTL